MHTEAENNQQGHVNPTASEPAAEVTAGKMINMDAHVQTPQRKPENAMRNWIYPQHAVFFPLFLASEAVVETCRNP